jgi:hypothetical protein
LRMSPARAGHEAIETIENAALNWRIEALHIAA